ncbi:hypothetical protein ACF0H5_001189 [Mactra antiquata]
MDVKEQSVTLSDVITQLITLHTCLNDTKNELLSEVRSVNRSITEIKTELSTLKDNQEHLRSELIETKQNQENFESRLNIVEQKVSHISDWSDTLDIDCEHIMNTVESKTSKISQLEDDIEKLNIKSIETSMRVFGLNSAANEDTTYLKSMIIDKVLNVSSPNTKWSSDDIMNVHMIKNSHTDSNKYSPLYIVKFRFYEDKARVYGGRENLRKNGIRVGDDLTYKQRNKLKSLKLMGKTAYYYKGELCYRPDRQVNEENFNDNGGRVFKKATRTK